MRKLWKALLMSTPLLLLASTGFAEEAITAESVQTHANYLWTLIAAVLVFLMQAGFAMVESGFTRAKNAVNIMMKNLMDFSMGSLAFWAVGFGIMFGATNGGWIGTDGFFLSYFDGSDPWVFCFWIFQCVFAATAATIVSGAVAERMKFISYLIYSVVITAIVYPLFGHWAWGNLFHADQAAWLADMGFIDFAGSTVVHSIGAWFGLAGTVMLGPRLGRYTKEGKIKPIPGHSLTLATLGVFILWFGWFGFNAGSTTTADVSIARIAVNTNLAAAAGAVLAMITAWILFKKPDVGMSLNGALAGLVAITAPCANVTPTSAVIIGLIAGVLVVLSVKFFDKIKVDDPVGAISVHGVCGAFGTLAAALFAEEGFKMAQLGVQALGVGVAFAWAFGTGLITFGIIKLVIGLRVSPEEEQEGLDYGEHGAEAYPDFQSSTRHIA
ncbi:MAG: ammonium transporter [bacterium]|nr:ammonium transporter [bacterium]